MKTSLWRILGSVATSVVVLLITMWLEKEGREWFDNGKSGGVAGGSHEATMRAIVVPPSSPSTNGLERVGGHVQVKRDLRRCVVLPLLHPELFCSSPPSSPLPPPPSGILLHGPPGTGKTMLARATAVDSNASFLAITASVLESKWWGETPKLLAAAFGVARQSAPCVLFFDEIDGIGGRARSDADDNGVYTLKCELLRHMDAVMQQYAGGADVKRVQPKIAVVACTNCPDRLDTALRRRFERHVYVGLPDVVERRAILADSLGVGAEMSQQVAVATLGYSGADLHALYREASARRLDEVFDRWMRKQTDEKKPVDQKKKRDVGPRKEDAVERQRDVTMDDWCAAAKVLGWKFLWEEVPRT